MAASSRSLALSECSKHFDASTFSDDESCIAGCSARAKRFHPKSAAEANSKKQQFEMRHILECFGIMSSPQCMDSTVLGQPKVSQITREAFNKVVGALQGSYFINGFH